MTEPLFRLTRSQVVLVLIACLIFGLQFGLNFAISNQNQYLLPALKALHPDLFSRDWVVNHQTNYHILFPAIATFLLSISPSGWAFAIVNVICSALVGMVIFCIIREVVDRQFVLPTFLIVIALCTLTQTNSAAGVYICSSIFQPSSIGALGFLAGILFFLRKQYWVSGCCIALGGINHANYLMLAFPIFGLAHLISGRERPLIRLVQQFLIPALAVIPFVPLMLQMANSPDAAAANHIYVDIRLPHHHNPSFFGYELLPFGLGLFAGVLLGWKQLHKQSTQQNQFRAMFIAMVTCVTVGLLCTTVIFSYSVARFMPWRVTPLVMFFVQIIGTAGVLHFFTANTNSGWFSAIRPFVTKHLVTISLLLWVAGGVVPLSLLYSRSNLLSGFPKEDAELYTWARTTDKDALFCIPPLLEDFRIQAERSVVIDWKPAPSMPSEVVEWYHRMEAISGVPGFTHLEMARQGYNAADSVRLQNLKTEYGINYAVFEKSQLKQTINEPVAFENERYLVFQVP